MSHLVHAYNSTKCDATGYSPYHLMFGREVRLPVDLCFGTSPDGIEEASHTRYVTKLKEDLKQAYKLDSADKRHKRNKRLYDRRVTFQSIEIGDRVLLRNLGLRGKHKLESKWSPDPYVVVVGKMPNLPVFKIKREDGRLGTKTIHRDHLLPIEQLVRMPRTDQDADPPEKPKTRADTHKRSRRDPRPENQELQEFSDSSSDMEYYVPHCVTRREPVPRVLNTARPVIELENDSNPEEVDHNSEPEPEDEECDPEVAPEESSEAGSESEEEVSEVQEDRRQPSSEPRPKRTVKPTIRLTYDEPGRSRDERLTIVHRRIVIKIGKPYTH